MLRPQFLNSNEFQCGGQWLNMAEQAGKMIFLIKSHFNSKVNEEIITSRLKQL